MYWCVVVFAAAVFAPCVSATFPPVVNPPPIPNQDVKTVDISRQGFYVPGDLHINPPLVKEEGYLPPLPPDPKVDDQRWIIYENQSDEKVDIQSSTETFDRYYSNGLPAVGPVATPVPDDSYIAQPSGTSKVLPPNRLTNSLPSGIWVLVKGPDDQYVPQRLVPIQSPQERISQIVSTDLNPQLPSETMKSIISSPTKISNTISPQVWVRSLPLVQQQKVYQDSATQIVNDPFPQQNVELTPPVKQYVQTDITQIPQQPVLSPKVTGYALPQSFQQTSKGGVINPVQQNVVASQAIVYKDEDISSPKQTVVIGQPDNYKGSDVIPDQGVVISQPSYKGVDLATQNQPVIVSQPTNYKGSDTGPPKTSFIYNQPDNYKGVDITPQTQSVIINQPLSIIKD